LGRAAQVAARERPVAGRVLGTGRRARELEEAPCWGLPVRRLVPQPPTGIGCVGGSKKKKMAGVLQNEGLKKKQGSVVRARACARVPFCVCSSVHG
jgi:hypothetical protein